MTGMKVFLIAGLFFSGLGLSTFAAGNPISDESPITLALAVGGIGLAFFAAWKIQGFMKDIHTEIVQLRSELAHMKEKVDRLCDQ